MRFLGSQRLTDLTGRLRGGEAWKDALAASAGADAALELSWRKAMARRYSFLPVLFGSLLLWIIVASAVLVRRARARRRRDDVTTRRENGERRARIARAAARRAPQGPRGDRVLDDEALHEATSARSRGPPRRARRPLVHAPLTLPISRAPLTPRAMNRTIHAALCAAVFSTAGCGAGHNFVSPTVAQGIAPFPAPGDIPLTPTPDIPSAPGPREALPSKPQALTSSRLRTPASGSNHTFKVQSKYDA